MFWEIRDVFNRAFYAIQDTKTPMINGMIGVAYNIAGNLLLVRYMGIGGLALSTSLSAAVCALLLAKDLRKKIGGINGIEIAISSCKALISSIVMGIVVFLVNAYLDRLFIGFKGELLTLVVDISTGMVVYIIMIAVLKVKEFTIAVNYIRRYSFKIMSIINNPKTQE